MLRTGENIELQAKDHMWVVSGLNDAHSDTICFSVTALFYSGKHSTLLGLL